MQEETKGERPGEKIKKKLEFNTQDLGELGKFIRLEYAIDILGQAVTEAYSAAIRDAIKVVPEEKLLATASETSQPLSYTAWNSCRSQILKSLEELL
jgi:hypothetical protein